MNEHEVLTLDLWHWQKKPGVSARSAGRQRQVDPWNWLASQLL